MKPTLAAAQLRGSLTQYLTTTYALADEDTGLALERFLGDPETGVFRGPYLRIRTPFHPAGDGWQSALEWRPSFTPWRHQATAWERLSTYKGAAEPTLVTNRHRIRPRGIRSPTSAGRVRCCTSRRTCGSGRWGGCSAG